MALIGEHRGCIVRAEHATKRGLELDAIQAVFALAVRMPLRSEVDRKQVELDLPCEPTDRPTVAPTAVATD